MSNELAERDEAPGRDKYHLQILGRAITVLSTFSVAKPKLTLDELSIRCELNKASLLRILRTLELSEMVVREDDGYRLGPQVLSLSNVYLSSLSLLSVARSHMLHLAEEAMQTVSLGTLDDLSVVYIAIERPQVEIGILGEVGGRQPANATALGKALLSGLDDGVLEQRLKGRSLTRLTHRTITDADELIAQVQQARRQGYAVDDEERGIGIRCVAAPITDLDGQVVAAISLAGPIFHMTEPALQRLRPLLVNVASRISFELGSPLANLEARNSAEAGRQAGNFGSR